MPGSKKRKTAHKNMMPIYMALGAIVLFLLAGYRTWSIKGKPVLPFEEIYSPSRELQRDISLIDRAISDECYKLGIPQEKIVFVSVLHKQQDVYSWSFSALEVRVPRQYSVLRAGNEINNAISNLKIPVKIRKNEETDKGLIYDIYWKNLLTHELKIEEETLLHKGSGKYPKIGIIIDDVGYERSVVGELFNLDLSLTFSILPYTPYTEFIAKNARNRGRETMLHLPMEPVNYPSINPGDGVLLTSMKKEEILNTLTNDLSQVPFISGVNNHMGSRFTKDRKKMEIVLSEIKKRGLYFIDSRTSTDTLAFKVAKSLDIKTANRDVFLDNDLSENTLKSQMERLCSLARHKGQAICIGHPHKKTLRLLKKYQQILKREAQVMPISDLIH